MQKIAKSCVVKDWRGGGKGLGSKSDLKVRGKSNRWLQNLEYSEVLKKQVRHSTT